ncbi:amino acid ABC transporter permease [Cytobacillus sp. S13-E01]|uniref:amino acid ABC transporter permease n=1 Tax=Cytobacillus sp. S13-E01 TaxID=3031326 RepID=UPI0023D88C93|nr:amino acid ABC transporter permease [Cytobacillus sp. S13-E01]MDF0726395.1 amino acid ABC transporter permease [Cytobacillus sp. S13-E01]
MIDIINLFTRTLSGFLEASLITIQLTAVGLILGTLLGLIFALFKISQSKTLRSIAALYITIIRGTPLIVQISFLYFGISSVIVLSGFWAGALALGIHNGAYIAEIFRGAIQSIDKGQYEASSSLGMTKTQSMRRIIFPQAFKRSIPALGNQFIIGLKDSSLVYVIGVAEIYSIANMEAAQSFQQFEAFFVAGLYYLALVMMFSFLFNRLENKLDVEKVR